MSSLTKHGGKSLVKYCATYLFGVIGPTLCNIFMTITLSVEMWQKICSMVNTGTITSIKFQHKGEILSTLLGNKSSFGVKTFRTCMYLICEPTRWRQKTCCTVFLPINTDVLLHAYGAFLRVLASVISREEHIWRIFSLYCS